MPPADTPRPSPLPPAVLLRTLFRLQALAFWRAPYLGGRLALASMQALGLVYALATAAALGFLLPDTLSVWAPGVSAFDAGATALLPAVGLLTVGRVLFQEVPTRGAEAFLLLPVPRRRVARAVAVRSLVSAFNAAPVAFLVPFAARTVREAAGPGAALAFAAGAVALVGLSHLVVVVWKTRLGAAPVRTLAVAAAVVGGVMALEVATGGLALAFVGVRGAALAGGLVAAAGALAWHMDRGLVAALSLDAPAARAWTTRRSAATGRLGFEHPGVRAFLALAGRLVARTRYPRAIVLNGIVTGSALAALAVAGDTGDKAALVFLFSVATVAVAAGQFALPFASAHFDRLLTLPGALDAFVGAALVGTAGSVAALGAVQGAVVLAVAPDLWPAVGAAVLFGMGVLTPVAVLGSTVAPKPLDVGERLMANYKVQSLAPQVMLGVVGALAVALVLALGPVAGRAALAAVGAAGALALPLWARAIQRRAQQQRHAVAARFRSAL